ncbi:hypothetical protein DNU06_15800 [Putridiphycobacter roseus]|uniref:Uncharacterized protein n=1 Tax=Putridiphycobacter roseus TaxID=2219161 RepID=A0A2W1N9Y5_9FLAO|nr:hypothetical protein DNU06_15800 [Putridiphycobacter roseus]
MCSKLNHKIEPETEIRSWKSYLKIWVAFIFIWLIAYKQKSLAYACSLFLIFNGIFFLFSILFDLILDRIGFRRFINNVNWIPFIIDFSLLISCAFIVYKENLGLFKFSIGVIAVIPILIVVLMKIRLLFATYKKQKHNKK